MSGAGLRRTRLRISWLGLALVVGSALVVGTWRGSSAPSASQRAAAIDAAVRCPSCEGISVADSSAATAVAIRRVVAARVRAGQSDAEIERYLASRYGPGILLRPPVRGATAWVWVLPPIAFVAGLAGITSVLWRRRRTESVHAAEEDRALVESALAHERLDGRGADPADVDGPGVDRGGIDRAGTGVR